MPVFLTHWELLRTENVGSGFGRNLWSFSKRWCTLIPADQRQLSSLLSGILGIFHVNVKTTTNLIAVVCSGLHPDMGRCNFCTALDLENIFCEFVYNSHSPCAPTIISSGARRVSLDLKGQCHWHRCVKNVYFRFEYLCKIEAIFENFSECQSDG